MNQLHNPTYLTHASFFSKPRPTKFQIGADQFLFISFHLTFLYMILYQLKLCIENENKDECISNHTALPGGHVSRGLRCLIGSTSSF